jgi:MFS family permease
MILLEERARPDRIRAWPHAWKLAVATVCFGAFMGQFDASVVTLTYRPMERAFGAGPAGVQWVSLAYLVALVALLVPVGRRSDRDGRKLSYLHGFVIFSLGSAACGLAPNLAILIGARVVQGAGAALLQANSVALVASCSPRGKLRQALGVQAAAQAVGLALGPTAGGLIVSTLGWRWVYALNVPVGLIAVVAGLFFLPRTVTRGPSTKANAGSSLLLGSSVAALLLAMSMLSGLRLPSWSLPVVVAAAVTAAVGLIVHERRSTDPLLTPVLSVPGMAAGLLTAMLAYIVLFGPLVLVPSVIEQRSGSSVLAGLTLSALPAGFALGAITAGAALPRRWSDRRRAGLGASMACISVAAALALPWSPGWIALVLGCMGLGLGVLAPANNASVMRSVPANVSATAGGLLNMTRGMGTALGISLVTLSLHYGGPRLAFAALLGAAVMCLLALQRSAP